MDAKEYIDTLRRICSTDYFCDNCDFKKNGTCPLDKSFLLSTPSEDIISSVEQWGKDNPLPHKVIRQDRILKHFPYAPLDKNGVIEQCPDYPTYGFSSTRCEKHNNDCYACRKEYWLEEVDE